MLEELINKIISEIEKKKEDYSSSLNELQENLELKSKINSEITIFLSKYDKTGVFDIGDLKISKKYLQEKGIIVDTVYYQNLLQIKKEIEETFPDRKSKISSKLENLINSIREYNSNYLREYTELTSQIYKYNNYLNSYENLIRILKKVLNKNFINDNELDFLDEYLTISDGDRLFIIENIVLNNAKMIEDKIKRVRQEALSKRVKSEKSSVTKTEPTAKNLETISENEVNLTEEEKKLLETVYSIVNKQNTSDKEFIGLLSDLEIDEMLIFIDDFDYPQQKLATILENIVIPKIKNKELKNIKEILLLYIDKYKELEQKNYEVISKRDDKKSEMNKVINRAQELLRYYDDNMHADEVRLYSGYLMSLKQLIEEANVVISDLELLDSDEYFNIFNQLIDIIELLSEKTIIKDSDEIQSINHITADEFYKGAYNLIIFPDSIDFCEQVNGDKTLDSSYYPKILKGLEKISKEKNIFTTSNHKVKDDDEKYEKLRRAKGSDYRIVYRASKASGLEKLFGREMHVAFAIGVGYGSRDSKADFYDFTKDMYDKVFDQIEEMIKILNSDDVEAIKKLVNEQFSKMNKLIGVAAESKNISSLGGLGGTQNE